MKLELWGNGWVQPLALNTGRDAVLGLVVTAREWSERSWPEDPSGNKELEACFGMARGRIPPRLDDEFGLTGTTTPPESAPFLTNFGFF